MNGKVISVETTAERILIAREHQIAARKAGNVLLENTWSEAMDRLLTVYLEEKKVNANS